jgi:hypothetical protein
MIWSDRLGVQVIIIGRKGSPKILCSQPERNTADLPLDSGTNLFLEHKPPGSVEATDSSEISHVRICDLHAIILPGQDLNF